MKSDPIHLRKALPLGLLLLAIPVLAGCLRSDVTRHLKYNAGDDSFEVLSVFDHIQAQELGELDHVRELYVARADLIYPVTPISIFSEPAWIRKSDAEYIEMNLGAASNGATETRRTGFPLDSVAVKPGKFFFNKNGMPAYYHHMVVPGEALDLFLARVSRSINEATVKAAKEELKRRAEGHPTQTWEDVRREISTWYSKGQTRGKAGSRTESFPGDVLDERSLALLAQAASASNLKISRSRTQFQITLPLTPADAEEAAATIELAKRQVLDRAKEEEASPRQIAVLRSIRAEAADSGKLTVSIDIGNLLGGDAAEPEFSPSNRTYLDNAAVVDGLKKRGIPFDEKLTYKNVLKEFLK